MSSPYTVQQCDEEIAAIDEEIRKLRGVAVAFSVGKKSFDFRGKRRELLLEREEWLTRRSIAGGGNPFQGPKLVP